MAGRLVITVELKLFPEHWAQTHDTQDHQGQKGDFVSRWLPLRLLDFTL